jgi:hypothetical protein
LDGSPLREGVWRMKTIEVDVTDEEYAKLERVVVDLNEQLYTGPQWTVEIVAAMWIQRCVQEFLMEQERGKSLEVAMTEAMKSFMEDTPHRHGGYKCIPYGGKLSYGLLVPWLKGRSR